MSGEGRHLPGHTKKNNRLLRSSTFENYWLCKKKAFKCRSSASHSIHFWQLLSWFMELAIRSPAPANGGGGGAFLISLQSTQKKKYRKLCQTLMNVKLPPPMPPMPPLRQQPPLSLLCDDDLCGFGAKDEDEASQASLCVSVSLTHFGQL